MTNNQTPSADIVEKWRAEFEEAFKVPEFMHWDGKEYAHKEKGALSGAAFTMNDWFGVWINARSTVVIPLHDIVGTLLGTDQMYKYIEVERLAKAIESQGYKTSRGE